MQFVAVPPGDPAALEAHLDGIVVIAKVDLAGLEPGIAKAHLEVFGHARLDALGAVDADREKSHAYGVTGVPTFVTGKHGLMGAQPYEALEQLVTQATD